MLLPDKSSQGVETLLTCKYCYVGQVDQSDLPCKCPHCQRLLSKREDSMRDGHFEALIEWLEGLYGREIGVFLAKRMAKQLKGKDCFSLFRVCEITNPSQVKEYERLKSLGCCGYSDNEITHFKTGRTFRYGFNFGH